MRACRRQPVDRPPVWIMRQAGRYLPEYRELRARHSLLTICQSPELACEVAMQPMRRFDLDAAILFSDLLVPVTALGVEFDIVENRGPVVARPVRDASSVAALALPPTLDRIGYVFETIRLMRAALKERVPVLGFAGAPFTMASYLVEGGATRDFRQTRLLMHSQPAVFTDLLERLADLGVAYVEEQARAGVSALQLFDSWVGCLSPAEYSRHVMPATRRVLEAARQSGLITIHFGTNCVGLLPLMADAGGDVLGVDWRVMLSDVRKVWPDRAVQGNLDPAALLAPPETLARMIDEVLDDAGPEPGHIFNLGHGILPETPVESVTLLIERISSRVFP
jgi:uroporphyrinogen decarboxylase